MSEINESRREFLMLVGYVAPVVLTLSVMPAHAGTGSGNNVELKVLKGNNGLGNGPDGPPPGIFKQQLPQNDETPVQPGQPDYKDGGPKK
jgi:hypothetical protein